MNIKTTLKASVAAAALFAVAVPTAEAASVDSGKAAKVTMSGHFNKAFFWADNGSASRATVVDNDVSQSRFRINADLPINEALTARGHMEAGFNSNTMGSVGIVDTNSTLTSSNDTAGGSSNDASVRKTYLGFMHKQFGTLVLGKDGEATDGAFLQVANPASDIVDSGTILGGGVQLQTSNAADNTFSTNKVSTFVTGFDGTNVDGLHYDSPKMGGFQVKYSFTGDQASKVGAFFGGKFGGFGVEAGVGYEHLAGASTSLDSILMASAGVTHDSGFSIGVGWGEEDAKASGGVEGETIYVVVGYSADLISAGSTSFAVQYLESDDAVAKGDSTEVITIGVEQGLASGLKGYAGLQFSEADQTGTNYEDVTVFMTGAKLLF